MEFETDIGWHQSVDQSNNSIYSVTPFSCICQHNTVWCQYIWCCLFSSAGNWIFQKYCNVKVNARFLWIPTPRWRCSNCNVQHSVSHFSPLHFWSFITYSAQKTSSVAGGSVLSVCARRSRLLFGATDLWPRLLGPTSWASDSSRLRQCRGDKHLKEVARSRKK